MNLYSYVTYEHEPILRYTIFYLEQFWWQAMSANTYKYEGKKASLEAQPKTKNTEKSKHLQSIETLTANKQATVPQKGYEFVGIAG